MEVDGTALPAWLLGPLGTLLGVPPPGIVVENGATDCVRPAGSQIGPVLTGNLDAFVHPDEQASQVTLGAGRAVLPLTVAPAPARTAPAWQPTSIHHTGDVLSHGGHRWRAQWWPQSREPGTTGQYGVRVDLGPAGRTPARGPRRTAGAGPPAPRAGGPAPGRRLTTGRPSPVRRRARIRAASGRRPG
ncbi:hypothetical protein [Micromonospora coxensis]|uniref:hypothetical protein n=1 Tax=Micromonospora coxensis TaxID=356852 RepID=UPI00156128CE|nr:hypothetical protein [Micromonospora coxensis]